MTRAERSFAKAWPVQRHASACDERREGDVIAGCTHHVAADGAVRWLGAVRAVRRKGGQAANETAVLAICYLDNRHRRRRPRSPSSSPPSHPSSLPPSLPPSIRPTLSSPARRFHLRSSGVYVRRQVTRNVAAAGAAVFAYRANFEVETIIARVRSRDGLTSRPRFVAFRCTVRPLPRPMYREIWRTVSLSLSSSHEPTEE